MLQADNLNWGIRTSDGFRSTSLRRWARQKKTQWNLKPRSYKLPFMWCCISHHFFISLLGLYHINKVLIYYYIFTASKCPVLAMCLKCAVILVFKFTHMHKDKEQPIARKSLEADALKRVKSKYGGAEAGFKRLQCTSSFFLFFLSTLFLMKLSTHLVKPYKHMCKIKVKD